MLRRRFMLEDNIPKYLYTFEVLYYSDLPIPFLGGHYKHSNENVITSTLNSSIVGKFSLLSDEFYGSHGIYTISCEQPFLGPMITSSGPIQESDLGYVGGLFVGSYIDNTGVWLGWTCVKDVGECILTGDIHHLWPGFDVYILNLGTLPHSVLSLNLPTALKEVHSGALETWSGLSLLKIPSNVTLIEGSIASDRYNSVLKTLILEPLTPPSSSALFPNYTFPEDFKIRVYADCVDTYKNDVYYKDYADYIDTINNTIVYYDRNGRQLLEQLDDFIDIPSYSKLNQATSIYLPNSITSIGDSAFKTCLSLTSVTIGNGVTSIGNNAFSGCSFLTSVTIGNSVTSIGDTAFAGCESFTSIAIPNSVTSIGKIAFFNCTSLTSITIPNSVTSIGDEAFARCYKLASITIPNSVTSIGLGTFSNCSSLTAITIPNSVTSIGYIALADCSSLTSITFEGTIEQWNTVTKDAYWNWDAPATVVHCTDGDVAL